MPEGHTLHRLARDQQKLFAGRPVLASSPQGRFADGAAMIDGRTLRRATAYGKHLFHDYCEDVTLHVHLGLYGKFTTGAGEPPEPRGALRLRLIGDGVWTDLRGATACELLEPPQVDQLLARLGPDPLRANSDPEPAYRRISRSRVNIGALLMDQSVLAGIGNVYRAEILFRHRQDPFAPGRSIEPELWRDMWADLVTVMKAGVRTGRIVTIDEEYRPRKRGALTRDEAVFVYRRTGLPCRVCGTAIRTQVLVQRNLFWCPKCQSS